MISLNAVGRSHGSRVLFRDVSLRITPGRRVALVGPNGAGKTTLLDIIAGEQRPDDGEVARGKGVVIGYLHQEIARVGGSQRHRRGAGRRAARWPRRPCAEDLQEPSGRRRG